MCCGYVVFHFDLLIGYRQPPVWGLIAVLGSFIATSFTNSSQVGA